MSKLNTNYEQLQKDMTLEKIIDIQTNKCRYCSKKTDEPCTGEDCKVRIKDYWRYWRVDAEENEKVALVLAYVTEQREYFENQDAALFSGLFPALAYFYKSIQGFIKGCYELEYSDIEERTLAYLNCFCSDDNRLQWYVFHDVKEYFYKIKNQRS